MTRKPTDKSSKNSGKPLQAEQDNSSATMSEVEAQREPTPEKSIAKEASNASSKADSKDESSESTTNISETNKSSDKVIETKTPPAAKTTEHSQAKNGKSVFSILVALLSITSISLVGWILYLNQQQEQNLAVTIQQQSQTIEEFESNIDQYQRENAQANQALEAYGRTINDLTNTQTLLRQQLTSTQDKLRLLSSTGKQEWVLEQINFYLDLAQKKIIFEDNIETAIALLQEAQSQLKQQADLNLYQLEQAITDDITKLSSLPKRNKTMLLMQLTSLENQVDGLSPIAPQLKSIVNENPPENKEWFDALLDTLSEIGDSAIKYRTHDEKVQPLLTQEQSNLLRTTIKLLISQAQTAIIENNPEYYQDRLLKAANLINEFFLLDETGEATASNLRLLAEQSFPKQVNVELKSFVVVQDLKEQRRLQWLSGQQINNGDQE